MTWASLKKADEFSANRGGCSLSGLIWRRRRCDTLARKLSTLPDDCNGVEELVLSIGCRDLNCSDPARCNADVRPTLSCCDGSIDATAAPAPKFNTFRELPRNWSKKRHVGVERIEVWRTCDQTSLAHTSSLAQRF